MSFNYDRLRKTVRVVENYTTYDPVEVYTASDELKFRAPGMARELIRLRDGVGELVESKRAAAELIREQTNTGLLPEYLNYIADAAEVMCDELTDLLNGDTE